MKKYGIPIFGMVRTEAPVAKTCHGMVLGENRDGIAIFRGIPYGGTCSGERRFLPPVPAEDWDGIKDCRKNGYYAVQCGCSISGSDNLGEYFSGGKKELFGVNEEQQSEDCLVLNVLTPGLDAAKRPVVVYIHGGGFSTGSGSLVLGADKFAREEDIVIVGVNHRLNVFGYLYLGEFDKKYAESGMVGMLDLVLALEWVRDNIEAFGGDPKKVTIMGESGGGMKVNLLMVMKKARGLFARAIVESSPMTVSGKSRESGTAYTEELLNSLGIETNEWRKILDIPAEKMLNAATKLETDPLCFLPVADDVNLKYQLNDGYAVPGFSRDVPVMIGASEDELAVFVQRDEMDVNWENIRKRLLEDTSNWFLKNDSITEENVDVVLNTFKEINEKDDSAEHLFIKMKSLLGQLGGDAYVQALAMADENTASVYQYLITYDSPHQEWTEKKYSWHTADLPLQMRIVLYEESEKLSRQMAHAWAAFIRTGNPSTEELLWPPFTKDKKMIMVFDEHSEARMDPLEKIRGIYRR